MKIILHLCQVLFCSGFPGLFSGFLFPFQPEKECIPCGQLQKLVPVSSLWN